MQELAQKQAAPFRLPTAQREKYGWWNTPPSLVNLECQDFLPPSPSRPQGPRDIWVVRRDQMVGLARALQHCAKWSGLPPAYSAVQSRTSANASNPCWRWTTCWMPPCWRLWGRSLGLPNPYRGGHVTGRGPRAPWGVGNCPAYPRLTRRGFWAWWCCQTRGYGSCPPKHAEMGTATSTGICQTAGCQIGATSPGGCRHPYGNTQRDLAGSDLPQLHRDHHCEEQCTGELEYHYEARVISRMSLHITPPYIPGQPGTNQELEDQWTSKPLLT